MGYITLRDGQYWTGPKGKISLPTEKIDLLYPMKGKQSDTKITDAMSQSYKNRDSGRFDGARMEYSEEFNQNVVSFDGVDDHVNFDNIIDVVTGNGKFSFSVWVIFDRTVNNSDRQGIFGTDSSINVFVFQYLASSSPPVFRTQLKDAGGNNIDQQFSYTASQGDSVLVTISYNKNNLLAMWGTRADGKIITEPDFITGVGGTSANGLDSASADEFLLGVERQPSDFPFKGSIGPFCCWNTNISHKDHYSFFEQTKPLI